MYLIDKSGTRAICRECRKVHAAKDCPKIERRLLQILMGPARPEREIRKMVGLTAREIDRIIDRIGRRRGRVG